MQMLLLPYFLMLIVGMLVPSVAYHGIFNPKTLVFIAATGGITLYFLIRKKFRASSLKIIAFALGGASFLLLWFLIGLFTDDSILASRLDQLKLFIITMTVPVITLFLLNEGKITREQVFKTVIYSNMAYCSIKLGALAFHLLGIIDLWDLMELAGFRIMKMSIFGSLQRLQSSLDIATPFILLFVLQSENLGRRTKIFYVFVSLLATLIAFSRFLLFVYAVSFALFFLSLSLSRLIRGITIAMLVLATGVGVIGIENIKTSIEQRWYSRASYQSDQVRRGQILALLSEHEEAPYLGKGLGAYSNELIRDKEIPHSYEVQWVAFFMQFGLFGTLLLCFPLGIITFSHIRTDSLCLFFLWILSGFTNPFLISLQSGIIYTLFFLSRK